VDTRALLRRLLSPGGFVLVACCFLLPFVTVSCSNTPGVSATYTGKDLVVGGRADFAVPDEYRPQVESDFPPDQAAVPSPSEMLAPYTKPIERQPLAALVLLVVVIGVLAVAIGPPWPRTLVAGGAGLIGAVFLVGAEVVARRAAVARINADAGPLVGPTATSEPHIVTGVSNGSGFWLALLLLCLLAGGNLIHLVRLSRVPAIQPAEAPVHDEQ
jgi:hypothetical protein